ncbi:polypeptide N-acetylgalactosaminyltransferase 1-like [Haliotis cracherodii]|uniref:polypeptide N-acetylgalactosaminyltransferase 1-like n=1 Tax=Haliotis cracherodii TaxID=6455 RepID=UPI0039EA9004
MMRLSERYIVTCVFVVLVFLTVYVMRGRLQAELVNISNIHVVKGLLKRRMVSAEEYRKNADLKIGNPLIDNYGKNDPSAMGENGRGIAFESDDMEKVRTVLEKHRVNTLASDRIPLNRIVPDSRFKECQGVSYDHDLPTASIIVPFHNEWPSILLRTVYSIINRTPRHLLQEILLLDDDSDMSELKGNLSTYVSKKFPEGLVRVVRMPGRMGLIKARQMGCKMAEGDVIVIFDSHMEVNIDWLQPLLTEIKKDRKTVALGTLDYIQAETMQYTWHENYVTRYGFDWRLIFFETFFRPDQYGEGNDSPKPGSVMVGTAYAVDKQYFAEIGGFDDKMKVWGGENLEIAWRVWMCGGRLVHLPCSKVGHIARVQPYKFPGGRRETEVFNYKRAVDVWIDPPYKKFIYDYFPEMERMDVGDLSERLAIKARLGCKNFTWFLENHWPELNVYDKNAAAWGSARNPATNRCLDNHQYLFQAAQPLFAEPCHYHYATQGFTWTTDGLLRTSLQCVVVKEIQVGGRPMLEDCLIGTKDKWSHVKGGKLEHVRSGLCLGMDSLGLIVNACFPDDESQKWIFNHYLYDSE